MALSIRSYYDITFWRLGQRPQQAKRTFAQFADLVVSLLRLHQRADTSIAFLFVLLYKINVIFPFETRASAVWASQGYSWDCPVKCQDTII